MSTEIEKIQIDNDGKTSLSEDITIQTKRNMNEKRS